MVQSTNPGIIGTVLINGERYRVRGQQSLRAQSFQQLSSTPWSQGLPPEVSAPQYTWHQGGFKSRQGNPGTSERGQNTDPRWPFKLVAGPEITDVVLTDSDSPVTSIFEALGQIWAIAGQRVYRVSTVDDSVVESKDFGVGFTGIMGLRWEDDYGLVTVKEDLGTGIATLTATGLTSGSGVPATGVAVQEERTGGETVSGSTTQSIPLHTTVSSGELLVVYLQGGGAASAISLPSGWVNLWYHNDSGSGIDTFRVIGRVADGSEGGTSISVSFDGTVPHSYAVERYSNWYGTIATGVAINWAGTTSPTTAPNPPSLTIPWGASETSFLIAVSSYDTSAQVTAAPSGYGNLDTYGPGLGTIGLADRTAAVATENPAGFTGPTTIDWQAFTIAIRAGPTPVATSSISPPADHLILVTVANKVSSGTPNQPSVTGCSMTWTAVETLVSGTLRLTVFRGQASAPSSGALSISLAGQSQSSVHWSVVDIGEATIGSNGQEAIAQSDSNSGTGTSLIVTLAAFQKAENGAFGAFVVTQSPANGGMGAGTGFTEIHETTNTADAVKLQTEFRDDQDNTVSSTWANSASIAIGIGIELIPASTTTQLLWKVTALGSPDTWTQSTDVVASRLAAGVNRLYKISETGELKNILSSIDPMTEANWADEVQVGKLFTEPTALIAYDRTVLSGKPEGLFAVADDGTAIPIVQRVALHEENFINSIVVDPWVYLPHSRGLYRWQPGLVQSVGLEKERLNESDIIGHFHALAADGDWIYAFMDKHESVSPVTYLVVGRERQGNEPALSPIIWDTLSYFTGHCMAAHIQGDPGRLWFGRGNDLAYIVLPNETGGAPDIEQEDWRFTLAGNRHSVRYKFDDWQEKDFHKVRVVGDNLTTTRYWIINYSIDGGAFLDTDINGNQMKVTTDGFHEYDLPTDNSGKEIQYRFDYVSNVNTESPVLLFFEPMGIPQSDKINVWALSLEIEENLSHSGQISETRSVEAQINDLLELTSTRQAVACSGPWGDNVYMSVRGVQLEDTTRDDRQAIQYHLSVLLQERS